MTEEEIRPIAEQYVEEYCHCSDGEYTDGSLICAGIGTALIIARRLEKENAELKETVTKMNNVITDTFRNLTKAKELLKQWLQANICDSVVLFSDTEQFLKEV